MLIHSMFQNITKQKADEHKRAHNIKFIVFTHKDVTIYTPESQLRLQYTILKCNFPDSPTVNVMNINASKHVTLLLARHIMGLYGNIGMTMLPELRVRDSVAATSRLSVLRSLLLTEYRLTG
jgi:hypothetical protein